jgi:hypothetical protein
VLLFIFCRLLFTADIRSAADELSDPTGVILV